LTGKLKVDTLVWEARCARTRRLIAGEALTETSVVGTKHGFSRIKSRQVNCFSLAAPHETIPCLPCQGTLARAGEGCGQKKMNSCWKKSWCGVPVLVLGLGVEWHSVYVMATESIPWKSTAENPFSGIKDKESKIWENENNPATEFRGNTIWSRWCHDLNSNSTSNKGRWNKLHWDESEQSRQISSGQTMESSE
jgi:hypothetical protein